VRIATFNVLHGRSPDDGQVDPDRLAAAVRSLDADVLGLQEVDRDQERSHGADLTAVAAEAVGAVDARFVPAVDVPPGAPACGIALVSRWAVTSWHVVRLPRSPIPVRDEPRVAVAAVLDGPFGPLTVCVTHLSFVPGRKVRQLRQVVRALDRSPAPRLVMGDLNMGPRLAALVSGLRPLARALTFPADRPRAQRDHVLADDGLTAAGPGEAVRLPLSDHRALVVPVDPS
jgi:endonuclease/exonuclease/phosphatase family metal-dependent hydrolase